MKPETSARLFLALLLFVVFLQVLIGVAMVAVEQNYFDAAWYLASAVLIVLVLAVLNVKRITLGQAMQDTFFMIGLIVLIGGFAFEFWPISVVGAVIFVAGLWRVTKPVG